MSGRQTRTKRSAPLAAKAMSIVLTFALAMMPWSASAIESAVENSSSAPAVEKVEASASSAAAEPAPVEEVKAEPSPDPAPAPEKAPAKEAEAAKSQSAESASAASAEPDKSTGITVTVETDTDDTKVTDKDSKSVAAAEKDADDTDKETEKKSEETDSPEMPAVTLSSGGVIVIAPEGALPKGATMTATPVSASAVEGAIENSVSDDQTIEAIVAYDVTLFDASGKEIQPALPVQITLPAPSADGDAALFHMEDTASAAEQVSNGTSGTAEHFSIYAVVITAPAGTHEYEDAAGAYNIKIRYEDQDGNQLPGIEGRSYQLTAGMSITISDIIGADSQIETEDAVYTFENAYFYWTGHYSGTKCYVTSFTASTRQAGQYGSHLQFSGTLYGTDGKGTAGTWDYNDTGVLHLVYSTEELYTLTYHSNYGQDLTSSQNLHAGSSVSALTYQQAFGEIPANYSFKGWSDASDGAVKWAAGAQVTSSVTRDLDLYAVWEISENNAVIYYECSPAGAGNLSSTTEVLRRTYSSKTKEYRWDNPKGATAIAKDGYVFDGWYCNGELVTTNPQLTDLATLWSFIEYNTQTGYCSGATFTAVFTEVPTIAYVADFNCCRSRWLVFRRLVLRKRACKRERPSYQGGYR